jgi:hypothetical protein
VAVLNFTNRKTSRLERLQVIGEENHQYRGSLADGFLVPIGMPARSGSLSSARAMARLAAGGVESVPRQTPQSELQVLLHRTTLPP